jgi:2-keto-3-deoxy-L-rhamnonate aldolase RhmA
LNGSFLTRLKKRELLLGTILTLPSPEVAELLSLSGLDWLFVDMEHTQIDVQDVQRILQAAGKEFPCLVRVPSMDEAVIKRVLETGPSGIIVPHVNTDREVEKILRWSKYPPEGSRSTGISRAQGYGFNFQDYMASANETLAVVPQVEHIDAVDDIESLVKVPGLSAIFVGPYDLSGSIGKLGKVEDPEVQDMIKKVINACSEVGLTAGIFGMDAEAARQYKDMGFSLIAVGMDTSFLSSSIQNMVLSLRGKSEIS